MKVYECISKVSKALGEGGIGKSRVNKQQNYAFRGIEDVLKALNPLLATNGLVILPKIVSRETIEKPSKSGGVLFYSRLVINHDFIAVEDGSSHTVTTVGEAMDSGDKSHNKAMSAAYKYAALLAFCIPTEGVQNDTEEESPEVGQAPSVNSQPNELDSLKISVKEYCDALDVEPLKVVEALGITDTNNMANVSLMLQTVKNLLSKVNAGNTNYSPAEVKILATRKG